MKNKCHYCRKETLDHSKCKVCFILLHESNKSMISPLCGMQHTLRGSYNLCVGCYGDKNIDPETTKNDSVTSEVEL